MNLLMELLAVPELQLYSAPTLKANADFFSLKKYETKIEPFRTVYTVLQKCTYVYKEKGAFSDSVEHAFGEEAEQTVEMHKGPMRRAAPLAFPNFPRTFPIELGLFSRFSADFRKNDTETPIRGHFRVQLPDECISICRAVAAGEPQRKHHGNTGVSPLDSVSMYTVSVCLSVCLYVRPSVCASGALFSIGRSVCRNYSGLFPSFIVHEKWKVDR